MKWRPFNVNDNVRVKLTSHGLEIHRQDSSGQLMMLARSFGIPARMIAGESNYSSAQTEASRFCRSR